MMQLTLEAALDMERIGRLLDRVRNLMLDGRWRTIPEICDEVGGSETGVSARLRDLRKPAHGAFRVEYRRRGEAGRGLFEYRVTK